MKRYLCIGLLCLCTLAICGGCGSSTHTTPTTATKLFAYILTNPPTGSAQSGNILPFTLDPATGVLTAAATPVAISSPSAIAVAPAGNFAYVTSLTGNTVQAFAIHAVTGEPTPVGAPVVTGNFPVSVVVDPTGNFVYVANNSSYTANPNTSSVSAYTVLSNGMLTAIPGSPFFNGIDPIPGQVVMAPSGKFIYVPSNNGVSIFAINSSTGALTPIAASPIIGGRVATMALNATGDIALVVTGTNSTSAEDCFSTISTYFVNTATGALTPTGSILAGGCFPASVSLNGGFAYVLDNNIDLTLSTYSIDPSTGALISVATPVNSGMSSFVFVDPTGKFLYTLGSTTLSPGVFAGAVTAYSIEAVTGAPIALNHVVNTGSNIPNAGTAFANQ